MNPLWFCIRIATSISLAGHDQDDELSSVAPSAKRHVAARHRTGGQTASER